jgi:hypothetical protein
LKRISDIFRKKDYVSEIMPLSQMSTAIAEWNSLYQNKSYGDGGNSLNLAAGICSELARLTTVEFSSQISGSKRADYLNRQYQRVIGKTRDFVEHACAQGGVILKPYPYKNELYISVVMAEAFYPTEFSSDGEISGGIFFESFSKDGYYYTRLEEHKLINGQYIINNSAYKSRLKSELPPPTLPPSTHALRASLSIHGTGMTLPKRNTTRRSNVNKNFFLNSGIFHALRKV